MATNNNQNGWLSGLGIGFGTPLNAVLEQPGNSSQETSQFDQLDRSAACSNTLKVSLHSSTFKSHIGHLTFLL